MSIPYNDTANKNGLIQNVEYLTGLSDGDISGDTTLLKRVTANINRYQQKAVTIIFDSQDEWDFDDPNNTDYPIATTSLVAGQRDYSFPTTLKILKIKRVDFTYDGTNWFQGRPIDPKEINFGLGNDTNTDSKFDINYPRYDMLSNAIRIYPEANATQVTAGAKLRIEFFREPIDFTSADTTKVSALDTPFQPYLSTGAAFEYCLRNDLTVKAQALAQVLANMEAQMRSYYGTKQQDREYRFVGNYVDYN